jgi:tetratricopeptide (TPR) repeat protein
MNEAMKAIFVRAALAAGILAGGFGSSSAQVKVWEGNLSLPTYEEGSPDPNPPFDTYATSQFSYPYTLRKNLTGRKTDHNWRAVLLENEYLKCSILPDIGGHVYTCTDKINGRPMFYANPSIKKAQIGYRGAWAAFGIEFNFPVSHNWVSMSPVDFAYATHPDGSASVTVGNIDRVYGMQWRVELIMRPGSALLEERVTLYNRSDVRHRYYWWNNAAVEVWDDSHIEYPMRFAASHGFTEVRRWPVGPEGSDLSVIRNQLSGPVSYFVYGSREPFMAIWNPHTQSGTAHYADYSDLPAKKIWSWGADAEGLAWRKALSDNDSAYVEVQAGLFRNQETYAFLDPGQTIQFSEYWMPVRDTGGISRANKIGVISLQHQGAKESAVLNVNQRLPGARIQLLENGKILWSETADLAPENSWVHSVSVENADAKVTFVLRDRDGTLLLQHADGNYDWDPESNIVVGPQQVDHLPPVENRTEDDWLNLGADQELNGKVVLALETYTTAIRKYPRSFALQVAAGRLAASLQRFAEAADLLRAAHMRDTSNAEIGYYLGIAEDGLGRTREAQAAYEVAYRQPPFRARAAARIAELDAQRGDLPAARKFLESGVESAPSDIRIREQLETITRAIGETTRADELARAGLAVDPMSDFLKEETGGPDFHHLAADPYRVLRVAAEYMSLGLYKKALTALTRAYPEVAPDESEPGSVLPQNHPLVRYYAAYCKSKLKNAKESDWKAASALSSSFVFPSSTTDRTVLESAVTFDPGDATAHYLLGTLLFSKGLYDQGVTQWIAAKRANPNMPVLDADMGKAWLYIKDDSTRALASFRDGTRNDPTNADNYAGLETAMSLSGVPAKERAEELGHYPAADAADSEMPANLVYQLALARAEAGQYEQALALFHGRFFPSEEGGVSAGQVEFEISLMQAKANADEGRCPEAQAFLANHHSDPVINEPFSRPYVTMGTIARKCGNQEQAESYLQKAAAGQAGADIVWAIRAQQLLGTNDPIKGRQKLQEWLAAYQRMNEPDGLNGWWWYNLGILQSALDQNGPARESFRKALLLPDRMMSHHLARVAMTDPGSDK